MFFSRIQIIRELKSLNAEIEARLEEDGVLPANIIYVSLDDPPSSSPAMCRLLRDQGGLERSKIRGIHRCSEINKATRLLRTGAIVYGDDFSGTGSQFKQGRNDVRDYIDGTFSEFFLLPCICEEALNVVEAQGVVAMYRKRHMKSERPLLPDSDFLKEKARLRLVRHSERTWGLGSLGFGMLATNVILSHGAPDTTPLIFRGDRGQTPWFGVVPRWAETEVSANTNGGQPG